MIERPTAILTLIDGGPPRHLQWHRFPDGARRDLLR